MIGVCTIITSFNASKNRSLSTELHSSHCLLVFASGVPLAAADLASPLAKIKGEETSLCYVIYHTLQIQYTACNITF